MASTMILSFSEITQKYYNKFIGAIKVTALREFITEIKKFHRQKNGIIRLYEKQNK